MYCIYFLTVAREACCFLSFTTDFSLYGTHPEETLTAGELYKKIRLKFFTLLFSFLEIEDVFIKLVGSGKEVVTASKV